MAQHLIGKVGTFSATYADSTRRIILRDEKSKGWRFDVDDDATLSTLGELVDACKGASVEELRFLIDIVIGAETILEHAEHDLARYGEIGVTG